MNPSCVEGNAEVSAKELIKSTDPMDRLIGKGLLEVNLRPDAHEFRAELEKIMTAKKIPTD